MSHFYFDFYFICEFSLFCPYFAPFLFAFSAVASARAIIPCSTLVAMVGKCSFVVAVCCMHCSIGRVHGEWQVARGLSLGLFANSPTALGLVAALLYLCACAFRMRTSAFVCVTQKANKQKNLIGELFVIFLLFLFCTITLTHTHACMHVNLHTSPTAADRAFRQSSAHPVASLTAAFNVIVQAARKFTKKPTSFVEKASTTLTTTARAK